MAKRALISVVALSLLLFAPVAANAEDEPEPDHGKEYQSPEEALKEDLAFTAKANGWTFEQALAQHEAADAVGEIASKIAEQEIEVLVGSALAAEPGDPPTLYIKGEADEFIRQVIKDSGREVHLSDGQPYSYLDLEERSALLYSALLEIGYSQFSAYIDITTGQINAALIPQDGLPSKPEEIIAKLPDELHKAVALTIVDKLDNRNEHAFGGARMTGPDLCTSGFTVVDPATGRTGVTTAAHCNVSRITEDGVGTLPTWGKSEHRGWWGDVEWHTTDHLEPAAFYARPNRLRPTESVEQWWQISVGESICVFGRSTNARVCSANVLSPWAVCFMDWTFVANLVLMDRDVTIGGDSGAAWSWNTRAYGTHVGDCFGVSTFTKAHHIGDALGVEVRTT